MDSTFNLMQMYRYRSCPSVSMGDWFQEPPMDTKICGYSIQFSWSVMSNSMWPHGLQHTRLPCSSAIPRACSNSRPSCQSVMPSNHLILCRPLLLLPSVFPSIRVFSNESVLCIRWPKYWSFSFSISPSKEYLGQHRRSGWLLIGQGW